MHRRVGPCTDTRVRLVSRHADDCRSPRQAENKQRGARAARAARGGAAARPQPALAPDAAGRRRTPPDPDARRHGPGRVHAAPRSC